MKRCVHLMFILLVTVAIILGLNFSTQTDLIYGEDGTAQTDSAVDAQTVYRDSDGDGVPDATERGPEGTDYNYDSNKNAIPDTEEANVASFHTTGASEQLQYITVTSSDGTTLSDIQAVDNPSSDDAPDGVDFPLGFVEFSVNVHPGDSVTVTLFPPDGESFDPNSKYYKYGPTPDNPIDHWYEFMFDGTTGAEIFDDSVVLHLEDGRRGDNDLLADGIIVDPGGLATASAAGPLNWSIPTDVVLECPGNTHPNYTGKPTSYDLVTFSPSDSIEAGCGDTEVITRTWTATDDSGNVSTGVQIIEVEDTTDPYLSQPADVWVAYPVNTDPSTMGFADVADECGDVGIDSSDEIISFEPGSGYVEIITRTWTATDECGNSISKPQIITVMEDTDGDGAPDYGRAVPMTRAKPIPVSVAAGWLTPTRMGMERLTAMTVLRATPPSIPVLQRSATVWTTTVTVLLMRAAQPITGMRTATPTAIPGTP